MLVRVLSPVSGLFTVTVKVMVAAWPGVRLPVQVRSGLVKLTDPMVAVALSLYAASSSTPSRGSVTVIPVYGVCPVSVTVNV